MFTLWTI